MSRNLDYDLGPIAMASPVRSLGCLLAYATTRARFLARNGARYSIFRTPCRARLALLLFSFLLLASPLAMAQDAKAIEYRAKATFLAAFPQFIDWPESTFPTQKAPFLLCVFGDFSFGTSLAEMTQTASIHGRRVEVRWAHKDHELRACQILFVSHSESRHYEKIFKAIEGASVLTVGETPDFLPSGGAIQFLLENDKLQFEVSLAAAEDAHLRISSNMLALAHHVIRAQAAKSSQIAQPAFRTLFSTSLLHGDGTR